ncbi:MAG: alpha/beta fold hydrolase [Clostridia bacterium]|nr:alpha/beta fold hydrolase [Clostridia bacterium]
MGVVLSVVTHPVFLWIVGVLVGSGILLWIVSYFVASYCVYNQTLRRRSKEQWSREMPSDLEPDSVRMYETGLEWAEKNKAYAKEVSIQRDGLRLCGEYYDLGYKRCVMVLSGRTETLKYGYYFAIPYAKCGCNVLVMDPRGHGLSDGEFNTVGFEESLDIVEWVKFLKNELGIESIIFHGICIGAAGGMLALTSGKCPEGVSAIVTEGMFPNFGESMKNHLIERKKPVFIMYDLINGWMKHYTGHSMNFGPIDVIDKLDKPLLMLHSREDLYSTPEYAEKLYELAGTKKKRLVWFEHGKHSMLRITDTELYDSAIAEFLSEI